MIHFYEVEVVEKNIFHLLLIVFVVVVSCARDSRNTRPEFADERNPEKMQISEISKKAKVAKV